MINRLSAPLVLAVVLTLPALHTHAQDKKPAMLNHIAVYVKDLKASTDFYKDVLGLDTIPEPFHDGRHTWFRIGGHSQLHIIQGAKTIDAHDKNIHLCFAVQSVEAFAKTLSAAGIKYEDWGGKIGGISARVDSVKQIYFQDPDNDWIEINDDKY